MRREKRAAVKTVPLASVECGGVDPELDVLVAEREELHDLAELAKDVLSQRELEIVLLSQAGRPASGYRRPLWPVGPIGRALP